MNTLITVPIQCEENLQKFIEVVEALYKIFITWAGSLKLLKN